MEKLEATDQQYVLSEGARHQILALKKVYPSSRSALLPALHIVQGEFGFIPDGPMEEVADILEILKGDVEQVVTFYRMYNTKRVGQFHVKICDSIACYLRGSDELIEQGKQKLGVELGGTTEDGQVTLSKIECLAACGQAPCLQVNDEYLYNVTPEQFEEMLETLSKAKENPYFIP
ncbi:MAG TPA: NADH-quinone oxidoreductase subunit NuoE [Chloroflexia bacterium]|nr:NADH-quinone oxidoreductase subunit NuoE [Chloroflexia bacterium]